MEAAAAAEEERLLNGELTEQPVSPAARLYLQPTFNCCIIMIIGCGKEIDADAIKSGLEATLVRHPRFSSILVESSGGQQKWVRTKVNLDDHLLMPPLELDQESPEEFVEEYITKLTRTRLDKSKPLWELHILNVKTKEADAVGVFRIHHALGDGISLMSLLLACTRRADDPDLLPTLPEKGRSVLKIGGILSFFASMGVFFIIFWNTLVDIMLFVATALFLKDTKTPIKGPPGVELNPRRFVHATLSLDDMRIIRTTINGTLNDVMLGVTSAGLTRYLSRRYGENQDGELGVINNLANIRLRSTVLVNVRRTPGLHALADMMARDTNKVEWGNRLGYLIIPFSMALKEDPLDYVLEAKAMAARKKLSLESIFTYASGALLIRFFGIKVGSLLTHRVLSNTTFSFSNLTGPVEEIQFFGNPIRYLAPAVYGIAHALSVNFLSYVDKVKLVLSVDEETIPDPCQLCEDIVEALTLIKEAALTRV